jgi:hypothetical protein
VPRRLALFTVFLFASAILLAACGGDPIPPTLVAFVGHLVDAELDANNQYVDVTSADVFVVGSAGVLTHTTTDATGRFVAGGLPKRIPVELVFSKPTDYARAVFTGDTEDNDSFLFTPAVYAFKVTSLQSIVDDYGAAIAATSALMTFDYASAGSGAMVRGRVVIPFRFPDGTIAYYNAPGAHVTVTDALGVDHRVFFRGDYPDPNPNGDPGPIDPNRTTTGGDAQFAAFGIPVVSSSTSGLGFPSAPVYVTVTTSSGTYTQATIVVEDGVTILDRFTSP